MSAPTQSYGLSCHYALVAAANAAGVMAERYRGDVTHPDRVATYAHFKTCEERMHRWIVAVERVMETEERLLAGGGRAGRSENVIVTPDNSADAGSMLCKNCTDSGATNANG